MIKNRFALERFHGKGSSLILSALEAAIKSVEPGALVRNALSFKGGTLAVHDMAGKGLKIDKINKVYVVGAGKAAAAMTMAVISTLRNKVTAGSINVPKGTKADIDRITVSFASHPVPSQEGVRGTKNIIKMIETADPDDLVIVVVSGGGSALMPLPAKGLTLKDKQETTAMLLASGATIHEINTVRKHLSAVKGGQLVRYTKARMLSLILSDVVGDDMSVISSGLTFPDSTTFTDALCILKKYGITDTRSAHHIVKGVKGLIEDTPKPGDPVFSRVSNVLIGNNELACKRIEDYFRSRKVRTKYLGSRFDGQARHFGAFMARRARDTNLRIPFALIAGGETTVALSKRPGKGGRNQEAALACALEGVKGIAAFLGTDGIDGNSDAAGAIVSEKSTARAEEIDAKSFLIKHDSYHALQKMRSLIFTGYTGTNVNDIAVVYRQGQ